MKQYPNYNQRREIQQVNNEKCAHGKRWHRERKASLLKLQEATRLSSSFHGASTLQSKASSKPNTPQAATSHCCHHEKADKDWQTSPAKKILDKNAAHINKVRRLKTQTETRLCTK